MKLFVFLVVFMNLEQWRHMLVSCKIITVELCGPETIINLEPSGEASSVTIHLNPKDHKRTCRLNITAPSSHVVNLQWHEEHRELLDNHSTGSSPCPLNIFLPENKRTAVWKGDPCAKDGLSDVDLLTPELRLTWTPPRFAFHARGRKLVITAVGQGDICKTEGQHTCMKIGWEPVLCVSEQLVCDGNPNCPKGAPTSDEDEALCKSHLIGHTSWQQLAEDVIRKLPSGIVKNNWLENKQKNNNADTENSQIPHINWKELKKLDNIVTTSEPDHHQHHDSEDSVSAALAHYGPWGYLMLGMLICGTVLMFCGLWECCFRKPKPPSDMQSQQQPTTVLIINRHDDGMTHQPPNYDDLDQPPSYMTLFPNFKLEALEDTSLVTDDPVSGADETDSDSATPSSSGDSSEEQSDNVDNEVVTNNSNSDSGNRDIEEIRGRHSPICIVTTV